MYNLEKIWIVTKVVYTKILSFLLDVLLDFMKDRNFYPLYGIVYILCLLGATPSHVNTNYFCREKNEEMLFAMFPRDNLSIEILQPYFLWVHTSKFYVPSLPGKNSDNVSYYCSFIERSCFTDDIVDCNFWRFLHSLGLQKFLDENYMEILRYYLYVLTICDELHGRDDYFNSLEEIMKRILYFNYKYDFSENEINTLLSYNFDIDYLHKKLDEEDIYGII